MKIRELINDNTTKYRATAFEHENKIVVIKKDTYNYYDNSTDERFEFSSIEEYENWKNTQDWIDIKKIEKVSNFKKVNAK